MSKFAVTVWRRRRNRDRKLRFVEADTAEHAIATVAASLPPDEQPGVYEAWPVERPGNNLRVTYARPPRWQLRLGRER